MPNLNQILSTCIVKNQRLAAQKIESFICDGAEKLHLVLDFDRTLTVGINQDGSDTSSWKILTKHLPPEALKQYQELFNTYRPLEIAGRMTVNDAESWWRGCLQLYVDYQVNLYAVENDFFTQMAIRPHVKQLFDLCGQYHIPTIILSAGVKDIIDLWCSKNHIKPSLVLSTQLITNTDGCIIGFNKSSVIHTLNKREMGHRELLKIKHSRPNILLLGDSLEDAHMVEGDQQVLRIRIYDPRQDDNIDRNSYIHQTFQYFDMIIDTGSVSPITHLLSLIDLLPSTDKIHDNSR